MNRKIIAKLLADSEPMQREMMEQQRRRKTKQQHYEEPPLNSFLLEDENNERQMVSDKEIKELAKQLAQLRARRGRLVIKFSRH